MTCRRVHIDRDRLGRYIEELGQCGLLPEGGVFRALYTQEWVEARQRVARWMEAIGLEVKEDAVGNLFGRLAGTGPGIILTGSHIDTVRQGGNYDGALGFISGLVAVHALKTEWGVPQKSVEVIATCEEEGSRFPCRMWGARAILGTIEDQEIDTLKDAAGVTIGQAMRERRYDPGAISAARRTDINAFLELHIEQGRILESEGLPLGIVTDITGITQFRVRLQGQADHAGTTPMDLRRDALVGFGHMVTAIQRMARDAGRPAVATVGTVRALPGAINVVPGQVEFTLDIRHPESEVKADLAARIRERCLEIASECGLAAEVSLHADIPGTPLDSSLIALLEEAARERGVSYKRMVSGAGHDAQVFARRVPAAMLFVPSRDGRSHSPVEFTSLNHAALGTEVLAAALHRLAY